MTFNHIFILCLLWNLVDANLGNCSVKKIPSRYALHFRCAGFRVTQVAEYMSNLKKDQDISTDQIVNAILSNPIQLTLERTIFPFTKRNLPTKRITLMPNWLRSNIRLQHVCIQNSNINGISNNAFNSPQFKSLEVFEIINVPLRQIYTKSLNGLNNLKILTLRDIQLSYIGLNILRPCENLEVFTMQKCGPQKIWLYNFFGASENYHLHKIDIDFCNLDGTINYITFLGLKALKELRLHNCNLTIIGQRSFDINLRTLTRLDLDLNELTSLPKGIFRNAKGTNITINLRNNPWHCDCELDDLRDFIQRNRFVKFHNIICKSPPNLKGAILISLPSLCEQSAEENPAEIVNVQLDTKPSMKPPLSQDSDSTISPVTNVPLTKSSDERTASFCTKKTKSIIDTIQYSNDFNLLEFESMQSNEDYNQVQSNENASIKCSFTSKNTMLYRSHVKGGLESLNFHRFCVIKKNLSMILPLDCSAFYSTVAENESDAWVLMNDKILAICLCALFMFVAFAVGFSIPFGIAKFYRRKYRPFTSRVVDVTIPARDNDDTLQSQGKIETVKQMESSNASLRRKSSSEQWQKPTLRMSMHQAVFENAKIDENAQIDDNIPPPLPPRNNLKPISS